MLVNERMSRPVISVTPDEPIHDVLAMFKKEHIRRAPVMKDGKLVAIDPEEKHRQQLAGWGDKNAEHQGWGIDQIPQHLVVFPHSSIVGNGTNPTILWDPPGYATGGTRTAANMGKEFYTCAVCSNGGPNEKGSTILGCVKWGFYVDKESKVTFSRPEPSCKSPDELKPAIDRWNLRQGAVPFRPDL